MLVRTSAFPIEIRVHSYSGKELRSCTCIYSYGNNPSMYYVAEWDQIAQFSPIADILS